MSSKMIVAFFLSGYLMRFLKWTAPDRELKVKDPVRHRAQDPSR